MEISNRLFLAKTTPITITIDTRHLPYNVFAKHYENDEKSTNQPDETRRFDKGRIDVTNIGDTLIGRATFEPGWKWSTSVKPIVQTDSCQIKHTMYVISEICM